MTVPRNTHLLWTSWKPLISPRHKRKWSRNFAEVVLLSDRHKARIQEVLSYSEHSWTFCYVASYNSSCQLLYITYGSLTLVLFTSYCCERRIRRKVMSLTRWNGVFYLRLNIFLKWHGKFNKHKQYKLGPVKLLTKLLNNEF